LNAQIVASWFAVIALTLGGCSTYSANQNLLDAQHRAVSNMFKASSDYGKCVALNTLVLESAKNSNEASAGDIADAALSKCEQSLDAYGHYTTDLALAGC
jgi:hypothetical protein